MIEIEPLTGDESDLLPLVLHVVARRPAAELDEGDLSDRGECLVDGTYAVALEIEEGSDPRRAALAVFDQLHEICAPEDYRIIVGTPCPRCDGPLRADLGAWRVTGEGVRLARRGANRAAAPRPESLPRLLAV